MIILEKHLVSGYELRHYRREPDDVLTRKVDVDILACPERRGPVTSKVIGAAASRSGVWVVPCVRRNRLNTSLGYR